MDFFIKEQIFNFIINRILVKFSTRNYFLKLIIASDHFYKSKNILHAKSITQKLISSRNIKMHQQYPRALFIRWPGISLAPVKNINEIQFLMDARDRFDRKSNGCPPLVDSSRIHLPLMHLGSRRSQI